MRRNINLPLLGFSKLKSKLLDGSKTQTIRKPRKHPIKVGDKLYVYWMLRTKKCEKLGEARVTSVVRKRLVNITNEDAVKDGFKNLSEFDRLFHGEMHPDASMQDEFDIITFKWVLKLWELKKEYGSAELQRLKQIVATCPEKFRAAVCTEECDAFHVCRK